MKTNGISFSLLPSCNVFGSIFLLLFIFLLTVNRSGAEGTKQLNTNNVNSTSLYLCNDFTNHCTSSNGVRSQFATYNATQSAPDEERLYFVTANANEAVYMGFQGASLTNPARTIYFRIKNMAGTIVRAEAALPASGSGYITSFTQALNGPNQLPSPAITNGYDALIWTPPSPGTYYIEFTVKLNSNGSIYTGVFDLNLFDITIGNTVTHQPKPGRLYSKSWQYGEDNSFYSKQYIISDDSIITSVQFTGMEGGHWIQYCNQTGCGSTASNWITNRKSQYHQQVLFPQYKVFLNEPDSTLFPAASTLGEIDEPLPYGVQNCLNGHITFHIHVTKPGNVEMKLIFPSPYVSVTLNQAVVQGENIFEWNGLDGTTPVGQAVPNGTLISVSVTYINGLTNLPLYDVERNEFGFTVGLYKPAGTTPPVYWDDTNIPGGAANTTTGCTSPPGCHAWTGTASQGFGDLNTMNTWWYNVSTAIQMIPVEVFRGPQVLTFQPGSTTFCANSGGHVFSVAPDANTDVYHWSYSPPAGVTISQLNPGSYTVTVTFSPSAQSGYLKVYGTNTNCAMNGPVDSIPITINPVPVPNIQGLTSVCAGQTNVIYSTESGMTNYQWFVSSGGTITAGGTNTSNTVTITWTTAGLRTVSVNYINPATLCVNPNATVKTVTVNARPVPLLTGPSPVCVGTSGMIYSTNPGKTGYIWQISSGGAITSGGTSTSSTAVVTWNTTGAQWISVSYTDPVTQCASASPTQLNVTVNTLPVPVLNGPSSACVGVYGNIYTTDPGMNGYTWTVANGTIYLGGTSTSNVAYLVWNSVGNQSISVNYTLPFSACTAAAATTMTVNVKPLPMPVITSGPDSVCQGVPGQTYFTQTGMLGYDWTVTNGVITAGGGSSDHYATVTWLLPGTQSVNVKYTDPVTNCTAVVPASFPVTVSPLPAPFFTAGDPDVCINTPGHVYRTQPGMQDYNWTLAGGVITAGGSASDSMAVVTWTSAGDRYIDVTYRNPATQCDAAAPARFNVFVNPRPIPQFVVSADSVCLNSENNLYKTDPGKVNYQWQVTGGVITAGGGNADDSARVTWLSAGEQSISVAFTDPATLCVPEHATVLAVFVKSLPVPDVTGPAEACLNAPGAVYVTQPGMSGYQWNLTGGTLTYGMTLDSVYVIWNQTGTQNISVSYTATNGCTAAAPGILNVEVNTLPHPELTGDTVACAGRMKTYTTEAGMQSYVWIIPLAGSVLNGGTSSDHLVTVLWNNAGTDTLKVNYALGTGCTAPVPATLPVRVNPSPVPSLTEIPEGLNCLTFSNQYSTQPGMSGYSWSISPGGSLLSGATTNSIGVQWNTQGDHWVSVNYSNAFGCSALTPAVKNLVVHPLPETRITADPEPDCAEHIHLFHAPANPECVFGWTVTPAAVGSVAAGQGLPDVTISWFMHGEATIALTVSNNISGCFASADTQVTIHPTPHPVFTRCFDAVTTPAAKPFILRGATPGMSGQGRYSGNHLQFDSVSGYYRFHPEGTTPGLYPVSYTFENHYGCQSFPVWVNIRIQNNSFACGNLLNDVRDGKNYETVMIGSRCWMKENLNYGTAIDDGIPSTDNCTSEKKCPDKEADCASAGGFYQWNELMQYGFSIEEKGLCPPEWHVPTLSEWQDMLRALGTWVIPPDGVAGSFLKDTSRVQGFQAIASGVFYHDHQWAFMTSPVAGSLYWTSTPSGDLRAFSRGINTRNPSVQYYAGSRENAFQVRCVKDL